MQTDLRLLRQTGWRSLKRTDSSSLTPIRLRSLRWIDWSLLRLIDLHSLTLTG